MPCSSGAFGESALPASPSSSEAALPVELANAALVVITGPSGAGKTNLALNLARRLRQAPPEQGAPGRALSPKAPPEQGRVAPPAPAVTLIDLDIVNAYFRSGDSLALLQHWGVAFLGPVYSASNLDAPSLMPGIAEAIAEASFGRRVILDVGGDPDGARALGRYAPQIRELQASGEGVSILFVMNACRALASELDENVTLLQGIERESGLKASGIVNNTHLKDLTTLELIAESAAMAAQLSERCGIPLLATTVPRRLWSGTPDWPVDAWVRTPWE